MDLSQCGATTTRLFRKTLFSNVNEDILDDLRRISSSPDEFRKIREAIKNMLTRPEVWTSDELPFGIKEHPCFSKLHIEFIGSTSEGLSLSEVSDGLVNEEFDVTAVLQTIEASESNHVTDQKTCLQIEHSEKYPGFVLLKMLMREVEDSHEWCGLCNIISNRDGSTHEFYLSPVAFTDEFFMMLSFRSSIENMTYAADCQEFHKLLEGEDERRDENGQTNENDNEHNVDKDKNTGSYPGFFIVTQEGPAVKTTFLAVSDRSAQYDCSLAIHCPKWPTVAEEFIRRRRPSGFPSQELVKRLTSRGCLIVPKHPEDSKSMLEWRLSFCLVERELMLNLSEAQKKCYLLLKAIWRKFLSPPFGKALQSYHLKNVLLWECEHVPSRDWTEATIVARVTGLLQRLQYYLFTEYCPHYVLPVNNLFKDIDQTVLFYAGMRVQTCIFQSKVVWIENDALFFLPPHKTRSSLDRNLRKTCMFAMKTIIEALVTDAARDVPKRTELHQISLLGEDARALLERELRNSFNKEYAELLSSYVQSASVFSLDTITRDYICSRGNPKQLLLASQDGLLDGVAAIANTAINWGHIIEVITILEVLQTENLKQYGFSEDFRAMEELKLLVRIGMDDFGRFSDDEEEHDDIDDDDEDEDDDDDYDDDVEHFVCDGCEFEITGVRYHCQSCEDFDLCEECLMVVRHPHEFEMIEGNTDSQGMTDEQCKQS